MIRLRSTDTALAVGGRGDVLVGAPCTGRSTTPCCRAHALSRLRKDVRPHIGIPTFLQGSPRHLELSVLGVVVVGEDNSKT